MKAYDASMDDEAFLRGEFDGDRGPIDDDVTSEDRQWAMGAHLSVLANFVAPILGWIGGPLIVFLITKDANPYVKNHAREALNMGISYTIYAMVCAVLAMIVIGIFGLVVLLIASIVYPILAAVAANAGRTYRYPFIFRLVK